MKKATPTIISGKHTRDILVPTLIERIKSLSFKPTLAIIQVGAREDSTAFIRAKKNFASKIGIQEKHIQLSETISQGELTTVIEQCNEDSTIHGIIIQLPLPASLDRDAVIETIDPDKDADGLTSTNVKRWLEGREDALMPATARGIRELCAQYGITLFGKRVVIIGRSMLVGTPIAALCLAENATVTICHSKTKNLAVHTREADIIISAVGKPKLIGKKHVKKGQVIIDVGITVTQSNTSNKVVGDVDLRAVLPVIGSKGMITPVPGGVGPMTVLGLFENVVDLIKGKE